MTIDAYNQFICWREEPPVPPAIKPRKVPFSPSTRLPTDPHNPANWMSRTNAENIVAGWSKENRIFEGRPLIDCAVGFVLTDADPFFFLDLDGCRTPTGWDQESTAVFQMFAGAAAEVSISGTGLHIMGRCDQQLLRDRAHKFGSPMRPKPTWLEFYTRARFIALGYGFTGDFNLDCTAQLLRFVPTKEQAGDVDFEGDTDPAFTGPTDVSEQIKIMLASAGGPKVAFGEKISNKSVWEGDAAILCQAFPSSSGDVFDRSSAVMSFLCRAAYFSGRNAKNMAEMLFRSPLYQNSPDIQDKWGPGRPGFLQEEIERARGKVQKVYDRPANRAFEGIVCEDTVALHIAADFAGRLINSGGNWYHWDGRRFVREETQTAFLIVRDYCRTVAATCDNPKDFARYTSVNFVKATQTLVSADGDINKPATIFDTDQWLLNTVSGIVDLRTGELTKHDPGKFATKMTPVGPEFGTQCPQWMKFLNRIFNGDQELIGFVQRLVGYTLTGSVQEHVLPFLYGSGGNGKSVFLNVISYIMGDYAKNAPADMFTVTNGSQHPTDLASLMGARLVTASETEEGRRWAESRVKALVGGDPISARFMRGDFFTYHPTFKIWIASNHKPQLRNVDDAIRRRFRLIPFTVTIPTDERDSDLEQKLRSEAAGILAWAIEGCRAWRTSGLAAPQSVIVATDEYLADEDWLGQFLNDCCDIDPNGWAAIGMLYDFYVGWAEQNGEFKVKKKLFSQKLSGRGFAKHDTMNARGFRGLKLKSGQTVHFMPLRAVHDASLTGS